MMNMNRMSIGIKDKTDSFAIFFYQVVPLILVCNVHKHDF